MNVIAGIAVALGKALTPECRIYARQVLANAQALASELQALGARLVTGGTENHLMVADTQAGFGLDGRSAEETLDRVAITVNKQLIPDDPAPPLRPSGIRLGTPAATTRGMGEADMRLLARWIVEAIRGAGDVDKLARIRSEVQELCSRFPVPGFEAAE
jgi:glycine hydroxymethyltransferase